ncbi:hypothetical protein BJ508DRAFT_376005 [Ascobolus immersus RN42]|uniref:Pentacotripeptide-repeat region of PRORP domain-containing protein n=1 Tax=Ascobolus immersus RN42 TaxID=1160509 RepID=A0A3N4I7Q5_ASCIM|nr:hypothetical protein BJ508DRAFT_376005 [Ascobolus immersus RN42]
MKKSSPALYDGLSRALCIRPIPAVLQRQLRSSSIANTALISSTSSSSRCASTSKTQTARFLSEHPNQPNQPKLKSKASQPQFILPNNLPSSAPPTRREFPTSETPETAVYTPIKHQKKTAYDPANPLAHLRFILDQLLYPNIFVEAEKLVNLHGYTPDVELYEILLEACARFPVKRLGHGDHDGFQVTTLPMAWRFFQEAKQKGLTPSNGMLHHLLKILADSPDWIKRHEVLQEMKSLWYTLSPEGEIWVLESLFASEQFEEGLATLWDLRKKGITVRPETVEKILLALSRAGEVDDVVAVIRDKELVRREISLQVWEACLSAATRTFNGPATAYIFSQIMLPTFCPNFTPSSALLHDILHTCSRTGYPTIATKCITLLKELHSEPPTSKTYSDLFSSQIVSRSFSAAFKTLNTMLTSNPTLTLTPETASYAAPKLAAMGKSTLTRCKEILLSHQRKFLLNSIYPLNFLLTAYTNLPKQALKYAFHFYKSISADFNIRPDHTTFLILFLTASQKIQRPRSTLTQAKKESPRADALVQQNVRFVRYLYAEMLETKGVWVSPEIWTLVVGIFVREGELADVVKVLRGFVEWNRVRLEDLGLKNEVKVGLTDDLGRKLAALVRAYEDGEGEELPGELVDVVKAQGEVSTEEGGVKVEEVEAVEDRRERRRGKLGWIWGLVERREVVEIAAGGFGKVVRYN